MSKLAIIRPTLNQCREAFSTIIGTKFNIPKSANKGGVGSKLEELLGIPASSACLDMCGDNPGGRGAELKAFPVKETNSRTRTLSLYPDNISVGTYVPAETVAITMVSPSAIPETVFEESRLYKKINLLMIIAYDRDGDMVSFHQEIMFDLIADENKDIYEVIKADYADIQASYVENGHTSSRVGRYIQVRTKGAGGGAPKTFAFYFRRQFLAQLMLRR